MILKEYLKTFHRWLFRKQVSYSQTGEDVIAHFYLSTIQRGVYVDVGTNDPVYLNNTYLFYKKGWHGICVEPNANRCQLIRLRRKRDIVVCAGVSSQAGDMHYYEFSPDTISTFSKLEAEEFKKLGHPLVKTSLVPTLPLAAILEKYLHGKEIDLLSVDTEGLDLEVLKSNDWQRFRPKIVITEIAEYRGKTLERTRQQFDEFMKIQRYHLLADTFINGLYISEEFAKQSHLF